MECSICGGTKASGYVQRLIAKGKLDASKVSNPSKFVINLGKANQKRIDELTSKKGQQMEKPKRKLRSVKERENSKLMAMEDKDAPDFSKKEVPTISLTDQLIGFLKPFQTGDLEDAYYSASGFTTSLIMFHLLKKYKNKCFISSNSAIHFWFEKNQIEYKTLPTFRKNFKKCISDEVELIAIPFGYIIPKNNEPHQNLLIYRTKLNQLERFEPHGLKPEALTLKESEQLDFEIKSLFSKLVPNPSTFVYLKPSHVYDEQEEGFQVIEGNEQAEYIEYNDKESKFKGYVGFCAMWSMFYLELVLKFPDVSGKELSKEVTKILQKFQTEDEGYVPFFRHIVGYLKSIQKDVKKLINRPDFDFEELEKEGSKLNKEVREWMSKKLPEL